MTQILIIVAILPALVLFLYIRKKDKNSPEPLGLMALLFFLGGATIISAIILEGVFGALLEMFFPEGSLIYNVIEYFIIVAGAEESGKYVVTRLTTWKNKAFDFTFDGVVYATTASLGFATFENLLYVLSSGLSVGILRALTAVPGHCIDGVFMGYFYGLAKQCEADGDKAGKKKNLIFALIAPILIHGFYDFCLSMKSILFILIFFIFEIAITVFAFIHINKLSKNDLKITSPQNISSDSSSGPVFTNPYTSTTVSTQRNYSEEIPVQLSADVSSESRNME